jgi:hypothetical protein
MNIPIYGKHQKAENHCPGVFINTIQVDSSFWILLDKTTEMKNTHH